MLDQLNTHADALRRSEARAVRARARDMIVAASSLGVLGLLVLYAVAAPT
jgi:hypothetical protein